MFATSLQAVSASSSQNAAQSVESFIDKKNMSNINSIKHLVFKIEG